MHTKTMEGLTGASMNMKLRNTPFRVYKDAERRGDMAVMEACPGSDQYRRQHICGRNSGYH